jgi:phage terminase small subunit
MSGSGNAAPLASLRDSCLSEKIALSDIRALFDEKGKLRPIHEWSDDIAAAVAGIDHRHRPRGGTVRKVKLWDKNAALEKLMKHLVLLVDKTDHSGEVTYRWRRPDEPEV